MSLPRTIVNLIEKLQLLPGVGEKTASRFAFYLIKQSDADRKVLGESISSLGDKLTTCDVCQNIAENNPCPVCESTERDEKTVCVLENPLDMVAFEQSGIFNGKYHILHGVISPLSGITPRDLKIKELIERLEKNEKIEEIILATNATVEGEATAVYLASTIQKNIPRNIKITRLGRGLPTGSDLEYADPQTLKGSLLGRTNFNIK